ncbi:MAG TPA: SCO6880 family protein [Candidatus Limnocylindrales bacterium]
MSTAVSELDVTGEDRLGGGGFYKPKGWGFFNLGPLGSVIAVFAGFAMIVSILTPWKVIGPLSILVVTGVFLFLATWPDRHGKTWMQRRAARTGYRSARRRGWNVYTPSVLTHMGSHKLPGVLAASDMHERVDEEGRPFAILRYPRHHLYVVSASANPDGASLLDSTDLARQVEAYGDKLANLALEPDFVQGIVTLETAPNSGPLMQQAVRSRQSSRATDLSKRVMEAVLDQYPQGSQGIHATVTATFRAPAPDVALDGTKIKRRNRQDEVEQVGDLLSIRLPHLFADLTEAGAGVVAPLTCDDIIERVRVAYNPGDRVAYDQARAAGEPRPVTLWSSAGPAGAEAHWNWYEHGGGGSVTWEFTGFTTSRVQPRALLPLLETAGLDAVTRVSIIYQPVDPSRAAHIVEANYNAAAGRVMDAKKPTARQNRVAADADRARMSEANGHALIDFAVLVTTTVRDPAHLAKVKAAIGRLGPNARLNLRPQNGLQDAAFAQGIGVLGLVTDKHLRLPRGLMQGM